VRDIRSASDAKTLASWEVRIGVAHALTEVALTEPVDRVRREFPRVSLSFSTGWSRDLLERVRARGLDGAIVLLPDSERPPAGLDATRLGQERLVVVGARRGRARAVGLASLSGAGAPAAGPARRQPPAARGRRDLHLRAPARPRGP
jgi:hypothetical protein